MTEDPIPDEGVILRADNGDVIRHDATGLILRLSDKVIADIAARLDLQPTAPGSAAATLPELPGDIDLWAPRLHGDWVHFQANLPGADSARGYRRHVDGGAILAEARGPLLGILGIGGARAALGTPGPARFRWHVMGPADDIGAVGMGGEGDAPAVSGMEPLRELTVEALIADELLSRRRKACQPLPLVWVRTETDSTSEAAALAGGKAATNLDRALANLSAAAKRLGTQAQVPAVVLDYALEDVTGDPTGYRDGMMALMAHLTKRMSKHGFARPIFLTAFDCGTQDVTRGPGLEGQWELSWNHGDHPLVIAAPSYAFQIDDTGRLTDAGRQEKAMALADALEAVQAGESWACPTIQLAERNGNEVRLTCKAALPLVIDGSDPFGAGKTAGFALQGVTNGAGIAGVEIDSKDQKVVILRLTKRPEGDVTVTYAHAATAGEGPYPANRGALRDAWGQDGRRRWALPARLKLTGGA